MITAACALMAVGLFVYVFAPVANLAHGEQKTRLSYLRERKEVVYENLRDLNFEFKAGKFPESDYFTMRASLENEAAVVLAEIEDLERGVR
ncbi:MAG: hypothetical protein JWO20_2784 [Candidatus Angelobacter sp.]|jgi:hypothetical protein|nr:hypothetical protein [Candidatus Angelobacter sp.]